MAARSSVVRPSGEVGIEASRRRRRDKAGQGGAAVQTATCACAVRAASKAVAAMAGTVCAQGKGETRRSDEQGEGVRDARGEQGHGGDGRSAPAK